MISPPAVGFIRIIARPIVVLPEPDSPTKPKVSPLYIRKLALSTAVNGFLREPNLTVRSRTSTRTFFSFFSFSFILQPPLRKSLYGFRWIQLRSSWVHQPCSHFVSWAYIKERRSFNKVNIQSVRITRCKGISFDFLHQIRRCTCN